MYNSLMTPILTLFIISIPTMIYYDLMFFTLSCLLMDYIMNLYTPDVQMMYETKNMNMSHLISDALSQLLCILIFMILMGMMLSPQPLSHLLPPLIISLLFITLFAFKTSNFFMFYILFEASVVPTALLITILGYQPERLQASIYLFIYTMLASLPLLLNMLLLLSHTLSLSTKMSPVLTPTHPLMAWGLIAAFLVKTPMYLLHQWLPKAHVEAPVTGSMILAGVLLKLGLYGIMRLIIMNKTIWHTLNTMIMSLSMWGSLMAALICLRQTDMKCLIALSSVAHMGMGLANCMINNKWGWVGTCILLMSHGICSSALFLLAYQYYTLMHSRSIIMFMGMHTATPVMSVWWLMGILGNSAIPPFLNLVGELLLIMGLMLSSLIWMVVIIMTSMLTLSYSVFMYIQLHHGEISWSSKTIRNTHSFSLASWSLLQPLLMMSLLIHYLN